MPAPSTTTRRGFLAVSAGATAALAAGCGGGGKAASATPTAAAIAARRAGRLSALRAAVRGRVLSPGSKAYASARLLYNTRFDGVHPPAVVQVKDARDVQAVVRWARKYDRTLVVRSGGNAYNGASTSRTAVVVDVGLLRTVSVANGVATIGPGARNVEVYTGLARKGAAIPSGSCPNVALGGLMTGGGMGLTGRAWGLTLDQVRAFDVVTMDGARKRVDARSDPDLFWALRGGGGSFAIVCGAELTAHSAPAGAWVSGSWPASRRADVLQAWDQVAPGAPAAATLICTVSGGGVTLIGQHLGSAAALARLVAPIADAGGSAVRTGTLSWLALQQRWAACSKNTVAGCRVLPRATFAASSLYVSAPLSRAGAAAWAAAADQGTTLVCDAYGGAIGDVAPDATAFVHRDARFSTQILSYTTIGTAKARVARARKLMAPHGDGGAYQNYADPDLGGPLRAYYGTNLVRLEQVKRAVDPHGLLTPTQGVPAAKGAGAG
jgi:FAD/FMN-containing dehydrogenase